ncbi:cytochrome bd oxidase small subunit CydS [Paenibacillus koleovorans]
METFLIMAAPLITVAAAVAGLFIWGAKGSVTPRK